VHRVGSLISEVLRAHEPLSRSQARVRAIELLAEVGIPGPGRVASTTIRTSSRAACASA